MSQTQPISYIKSHTTQLRTLFNNHFNFLFIIPSSSSSSITSPTSSLSNHQHNLLSYYYIPSLLKLKFYSQVKQNLIDKKIEQLKAHELCWLVIAKAQLRQNYFVQKNMLKFKYGDKYIQVIDKWLDLEDKHQGNNKQYVQRPINKKIQQYRQHFQYLNHKTTKYGYYNIKQVPVYLISTQWLAKFYDTANQSQQLQTNQQTNQQSSQSLSLSCLPPIDNRHLVTLLKYIDSNPHYIHYNYQILTSKYKQNIDYKLISPQSWNFLYSLFSGIQIKRFTTSQPTPCVQISYRKLNIHIVQNRYFHLINLQLLVCRFQSFSQILERLKRLIIAYKIVGFDKLSKQFEVIKVNKMNIDEIIHVIHDEEMDKIEESDERFEKVDVNLDVQEAKIYTIDKQQIIINIINNTNNNTNLFSQIKTLKTIITRQKCLNCGNHDNITLCICKSVHFCSDICQKSHKQHAKQCQRIRKQQLKLTKLLSDYQVIQTKIKLTNQDILKKGKVGLQNLRNTCYLNSALQCILRVDKLLQYFANNDHIKDLNVDNVLGSEGHLACAFGQLIKTYFTTNKRSIQPMNVLRIIAKNPQFRGSDHQDSQQFLNYFLDKLHEDLNRIKKKPYTEEIESNGRPDQVVSKQSWQNYLKRNQSFIQQLFTGQYRSQIRCPDCNRISITFDPFMSVTLQFPKPEKYLPFKGYILSLQGQYQKVQLTLPASIKTQLFLSKTFHQQVCVVNIQKKLIKKEWNNVVKLQKNYQEDGTVLIYIKEKLWEKIFDLHFVDGKKELIGFNRRIYVKQPESKEELFEEIYTHMKKPIEKALKQQFDNMEGYLQYCTANNIIQLLPKCQQQLQFPLFQQKNYTLILRFNPNAKLVQKIKINTCLSSYQVKQQCFNQSLSGCISLQSLIQNFKTPQLLTEDNMWYCNICKQHKMAQKIMKIYKSPQFLIIHLKRFNHKNTRYRNLIGVQKIQTEVKLQSIQQINNEKYQLLGVVNHFGSMTYGHYTAYVKKDDWVTYDDEKVKKCSVNGENAYLLVYKRVENIKK